MLRALILLFILLGLYLLIGVPRHGSRIDSAAEAYRSQIEQAFNAPRTADPLCLDFFFADFPHHDVDAYISIYHTARWKDLIDANLVTAQPNGDGNGFTYDLSPRGRELYQPADPAQPQHTVSTLCLGHTHLAKIIAMGRPKMGAQTVELAVRYQIGVDDMQPELLNGVGAALGMPLPQGTPPVYPEKAQLLTLGRQTPGLLNAVDITFGF